MSRLSTIIFINMIALLIAMSILATIFIEERWVIVIVSSSITFGLLAPIIAVRKLYFLAGAIPHSALLATVLAIPLARSICLGNEFVWSIIVGVALVYSVGYVIHKGVDADTATSVFVASTASLSVIALYYVLTSFPVETNIWAFIVGDPLLVSWSDVYVALIVASIAAVSVVLTYREHVVAGIDKDCVRLAGVRVKFYDWLLFTLLGVATITMLKIIGFVLEHVFILIPAAIAKIGSESATDALLISIIASITAGLTGLYITVVTGFAPAGVIGLVLFTIYILLLTTKILRG